MPEPRCVGHARGAGYSYYGLAKNCPHAECKALAATTPAASTPRSPETEGGGR